MLQEMGPNADCCGSNSQKFRLKVKESNEIPESG